MTTDHPSDVEIIRVNEPVLRQNDDVAQQNRLLFQNRGITVLNIMSSPGSGKTELIGRTLQRLQGTLNAGVIVGDLATENDALRLRACGVDARQIETGTQCHLDAEMIRRQVREMPLDRLQLLIIENVGNLVCPAAYDLGESHRIVLMSVTEGEDKPLKYPSIYRTADVVIINKIDIADVVGFDCRLAEHNTRMAAPKANVFTLSAKTGAGMEGWEQWLCNQVGSRFGGRPGPAEV